MAFGLPRIRVDPSGAGPESIQAAGASHSQRPADGFLTDRGGHHVMDLQSTMPGELAPEVREFYSRTLSALNDSGIPFLVGGAYALQRYTGIVRHTKDFDLFLLPDDLGRMLEEFDRLGCRTEVTFPHWLAKAYRGDHFFDLIFSSGNGTCRVDDDWFAHGVDDRVLDVPVRLVPAEEIIWQKAFVMERERFDGADIAHLIRARGDQLDWTRLLRRFDGPHGRVLLAHLVLFGFIYPDARSCIPESVMPELIGRLDVEADLPADRLCRGTLLSRAQYLPDIGWWGASDARLRPHGSMTPEQVAHWTAAIGKIP
jgi:hypothetical protein